MKTLNNYRPVYITLFLLLACLVVSYTYAQVDTTKFYIRHSKDEMTDQSHYYASYRLICVSEDNTKAFGVWPTFDVKKGKLAYTGLIVKSAGIGNCVEKGDLIFLFEDGSKVNLKAWSDFDCEGVSYFDLYGKGLPQLTKRLKAIRFTNGGTYDSYTHQVPEENRNYFIEVQQALNEKIIGNH